MAIERHLDAQGRRHVLPDDAGMLVSAGYPGFEGPIANGPHLRIGLNVGTATRMAQSLGGTRLEGVWRPGTIAITPPDRAGDTACGAVTMIGLAIVPGTSAMAAPPSVDRMDRLARGFNADPLLRAVLTALHHEADIHGASTAFFDHGIALILRRLGELDEPAPLRRSVYPLSLPRLKRVRAYAEAHLDARLSVADLAAMAGMDPSGFTRALQARTGLPPFAWLTRLRMERASTLLTFALPVTAVAAQVGYANAGKFAIAFRRTFGMPPSRWRSGR